MPSTREKLDRLLGAGGKPAKRPSPKRTEEVEPVDPVASSDAPPVSPSRAKPKKNRSAARAGLAKVERELLGKAASDESLSVKQRLERLVEATGRRAAAKAATPRPSRQPGASRLSEYAEFSELSGLVEQSSDPGPAVPLTELVPAEEMSNGLGTFLQVDWRYPLDHCHGKTRIERVFELSDDAFSLLSGAENDNGLNLERTVFLDTETTGLAGGSGTCAFLVGVGYLDEGTFLVRQFFMRDYHEEAAMLAELAALLPKFEALVTYNGKSYDVPLLETRFIMTRQRFSFERLAHFDLLHPARNLWKRRFESCRLAELEYMLLGLEREGDVPGHQIPEIYFSYLRSKRAQRVESVLTHNRYDILSLAALTATAGEMLDESHIPDDPMDDFSLGRLFERAQQTERSLRHYRRAMDGGLEGQAKREALAQIALQHKRMAEWSEAENHWRAILDEESEQSMSALSELAMLYEHRRGQFDLALDACEDALALISRHHDWSMSFREKWNEAFEHRRRRLRRRKKGIQLSREEQATLEQFE